MSSEEADEQAFYEVKKPWSELVPPEVPAGTPALRRLGPWPLPKGPLPVVGFLATVYDHVAAQVGARKG